MIPWKVKASVVYRVHAHSCSDETKPPPNITGIWRVWEREIDLFDHVDTVTRS